MEDVLDVYTCPYDPRRPLVCFDEKPQPLIAESRPALPMQPGQVEYYDYEYQRNGGCNLFMFFAPLEGWRHVKVTARRTKQDWEPAEAKRILDRLEFHYTPKHGSWLNMAEIELSVLSRQCLDDYIPDQATLEQAVSPWQTERNANQAKVNWRFTTADARIKLKRLYPSF